MSSAICFNLDQAKILSSGNVTRLNLYPAVENHEFILADCVEQDQSAHTVESLYLEVRGTFVKTFVL